MQNKISYWYGVKHWLLTLVIAPVLIEVMSKVFSLDFTGLVLEYFAFFMVISSVFSLPTLVVYTILFVVCIKKNVEPVLLKILLIGVSVLGIAITIYMFFGPDIIDSLFFWFPYALVSILTGWLIPIQKKAKGEEGVMK